MMMMPPPPPPSSSPPPPTMTTTVTPPTEAVMPDPDAIKMFVGQIPKSWTENDVRIYFQEFGQIFLVNVLRDKITKQSRGCCFITYYKRKSALEAQNACHNLKTLQGMNHPLQMKPADNENRAERKIFVGMLSKKVNEMDLRSMFCCFGLIEECSILRDGSSGQSRGCGFVTFSSKACALSAIKAMHHSVTMDGCSSPLVAKFADVQRDKVTKDAIALLTTLADPSSVAQKSSQYLPVLHLLQQQGNLLGGTYHHHHHPGGGLSPLVQSVIGSGGMGNSAFSGTTPSSATAADMATLTFLANLSTSSHHYNNGMHGTNTAANNNGGMSPSSRPPSVNAGGGGFGGYQFPAQVEGPEGSNLFIYHLPQEFSDTDMIQAFLPFGQILSAKVFIDKTTSLSKCFGFVSYDNAISAHLAIQAMNGFQIGPKRLKVQLKRSKEKPY